MSNKDKTIKQDHDHGSNEKNTGKDDRQFINTIKPPEPWPEEEEQIKNKGKHS
jgi:hypothetical protein